MTTTNTHIQSLYKSRKTVLELLETQNYNVDDYTDFSINEIDAMTTNNQLDMLVTHAANGTKVYVKYFTASKQIRPTNLDDIIEDLYSIDTILEKKDTLMIIIADEPNDTIITKLKYLFDHDGIFVVIHSLKRLQFNVLKHVLVPKSTILDEGELTMMKQTYNITHMSQLPEISRFDPQALAMCLRPGQVCKFVRSSNTALFSEYYRICV